MSVAIRPSIAVLVLALAAGGGYAIWAARHNESVDVAAPRVPESAPPPAAIGGYPASQFHIDHDRFLPATAPPVLAAAEVRFLAADDEVYGVVIDRHARAYPTRMLSYHHVVNDTINGIPVAVTY